MAMDWWRDNFWITLAVAIIVARNGTLPSPRNKSKVRKKRCMSKWGEILLFNFENCLFTSTPNVINQSPVQLPPLPPRGLLSPEHSSSQETPSQQPATYSVVNKVQKKKTVSTPSYIEPEDDYDDVEIPANMEKHHFETTVSSLWQAEEGSHSLF
ncbi:hypothetical protein MC885_000920 [Smutsia gigantea]|nr:hypothetical protein MC885_000920 [Smutsia gigantea]